MPDQDYQSMLDAQGLATIAAYTDAIGADMHLILARDGTPTSLVASAHRANLQVHAWTLRPENAFLPAMLQTPDGPEVAGCDDVLFGILKGAGVDAVFVDSPRRAGAFREGERYCARALPLTPDAAR